jgi:steroid 5-alpha reductase family enzyme
MNLDPSMQLASALLFCVVLMTVMWLIQRQTRNAGIVDIAWSAAIGLQGLFYALTGAGDAGRRILAGTLIGLWSLRLTVYLARRVLGHPEEGRYATLRANWGAAADRRLFGFYQMQAAAAFGFAVPVFLIARNPTQVPTALDVVGVAIWLIGMAGLAIADRQLARFRSRPENRGKTCRDGLWRYSRHPNYFFEWLHWWAYVPLAIGAPYGWVVVVVPLALLYFILFVTGIPPTEAQAIASRGDDYRRYQRETSAFVPWFPGKKTQSSQPTS